MLCPECSSLTADRDRLRRLYARELRSLVAASDESLSRDEFRNRSEDAAMARLRLEKARAALQEHKLTCGGESVMVGGAG